VQWQYSQISDETAVIKQSIRVLTVIIFVSTPAESRHVTVWITMLSATHACTFKNRLKCGKSEQLFILYRPNGFGCLLVFGEWFKLSQISDNTFLINSRTLGAFCTATLLSSINSVWFRFWSFLRMRSNSIAGRYRMSFESSTTVPSCPFSDVAILIRRKLQQTCLIQSLLPRDATHAGAVWFCPSVCPSVTFVSQMTRLISGTNSNRLPSPLLNFSHAYFHRYKTVIFGHRSKRMAGSAYEFTYLYERARGTCE